jgi:hypothetical protein
MNLAGGRKRHGFFRRWVPQSEAFLTTIGRSLQEWCETEKNEQD